MGSWDYRGSPVRKLAGGGRAGEGGRRARRAVFQSRHGWIWGRRGKRKTQDGVETFGLSTWVDGEARGRKRKRSSLNPPEPRIGASPWVPRSPSQPRPCFMTTCYTTLPRPQHTATSASVSLAALSPVPSGFPVKILECMEDGVWVRYAL